VILPFRWHKAGKSVVCDRRKGVSNAQRSLPDFQIAAALEFSAGFAGGLLVVEIANFVGLKSFAF